MVVDSTNSNGYLKVTLARLAALVFIATIFVGGYAQEQCAANEVERLMSIAKAAQ